MEWSSPLFSRPKFNRNFSVSAKRTLIYRHQTRTRNTAPQSVACASTYIMSVRMGKAGSC